MNLSDVKKWWRGVPRRHATTVMKIYFPDMDGEKYFDQHVDEEINAVQGGDNKILILGAPFEAYGVTVEKGFSWDGASVPFFLRWVISKFYKILKASCYHDKACKDARCWHDRLLADLTFCVMACEKENLAVWRCMSGLLGVRVGAYIGVGKNY